MSTLYWLGCTIQSMSYYRGPKLDVSNFQRESDGTITVKVCDSINREKLMNYKQVFLWLNCSQDVEWRKGSLNKVYGKSKANCNEMRAPFLSYLLLNYFFKGVSITCSS